MSVDPRPHPSAGKRRGDASAQASRRRLFLLTDLSRRDGRQLMAALDERLADQLQDGWRLSVRDVADVDATALSALPADAVIVDSDCRQRILDCRHPGRRLIATPAEAIARLSVAQLSLDQRLAGMAAADALLRRGYRHFHWTGRRDLDESPLAVGFREEIERAGLESTALTADRRQDDVPVAALSDTIPSNESVVVTTARARAPALVIEPSAHWLAAALVDWLDSQSGESAMALPVIPPRPLGSAEIEAMPPAFLDPLVATASQFIDERLSGATPVNVGDIATALAVPRRTLERRFRGSLGNSVHREVTRRQVARARQHLLEPNASPSTAAIAAAYPTTRMLSINFSKLCGLSPRAFQRAVVSRFS